MSPTLLLLSLVFAAPEATERSRAVVVQAFDQEVPGHIRTEFARAITSGLSRAGFDAEPVETCSEAECAVRVAREAGVDYLVFASWGVADRAFSVEIELIDVRSGSTVLTAEDGCTICGVAEGVDLAGEVASRLGEAINVDAADPGVIVVETSPEGAEVYIDGERQGQTPLEIELSSGEHALRLDKDGHSSLERRVVAVGGVRETVSLDLRPLPPPPGRTVGWVAMGTGVAGIAVGAPLIWLEQRPHQLSCTDVTMDDAGRCPLRYRTLEGGIALVSIGAAALITGAILVGVHHARRGKPRRNGRSVAWEPRGAGIGF